MLVGEPEKALDRFEPLLKIPCRKVSLSLFCPCSVVISSSPESHAKRQDAE
jgi:hypothetical protein